MDGVQEAVLTALAVKLFLAVMSGVFVFGMLRLLDKMTGVSFKKEVADASSDAFLRYAGMRFLGICIVVGAAFL